jgi:hypothetical protein
MRIDDAADKSPMTGILRICLLGVIVISVLAPYALDGRYSSYVIAFVGGLTLVGTLIVPMHNSLLLRVFSVGLAIAVLAAGYALLQSASFISNPLAHSIWEIVRSQLPDAAGAISVNPAATRDAVPTLLHPFMIFLAALVLHQRDDAAFDLWRRLALIAGALSLAALVQYGLLLMDVARPMVLLGAAAPLVKSSAAATLFGIAVLLLTGAAIRQLVSRGGGALPSQLAETSGRPARYFMLFLYLALAAGSAIALFLTSEARVLELTLIVLSAALAWLICSLSSRELPTLLRGALACIPAAILLTLYLTLVGRSTILAWPASDCVLRTVIAAIRDHPWLGTGLGTFSDVFPLYRVPACGISGVWNSADNFFLEGYLGMGLPFALLALFAVWYLFRILWTGYRTRRSFRLIPLLAMAILGLVLVHSAVGPSMQVPAVASIFAAAMGAAIVISLGRHMGAKTNRLTEIESGTAVDD